MSGFLFGLLYIGACLRQHLGQCRPWASLRDRAANHRSPTVQQRFT